MKFTLFILVAMLLLLLESNVHAINMPPLAVKLNCSVCHAIDHKIVGPSWQDVADRYSGKGIKTYVYAGKQYQLIEGLVAKVSMGGSGNWGTMPMPANDPKGIKQKEITELIIFEQSLADNKIITNNVKGN